MSRKLQLALFVAGSAVFGYLVTRIGVAALLADAADTGWMFVPILLLYGLVYVCNAGAWWLIMGDEPSRPPFWRAYAITVASFSLNFMTPMVNVGGEPFKIAAVAPWLGVRRAAGSVVIYQMLHAFGLLLSFLTAVALGALLLPRISRRFCDARRRLRRCSRADPAAPERPPPRRARAGAQPAAPAPAA